MIQCYEMVEINFEFKADDQLSISMSFPKILVSFFTNYPPFPSLFLGTSSPRSRESCRSPPPPPNPWCKSTKFFQFDFSPRQSPLRDHWTFLNKLKRNAQMISVSGSPLYYAGFVGRRTKTFLKNDCVRGTLLEVWPKNNSHSQLLLKWRLLCTTSITATIAWHQQRISAPSARS